MARVSLRATLPTLIRMQERYDPAAVEAAAQAAWQAADAFAADENAPGEKY